MITPFQMERIRLTYIILMRAEYDLPFNPISDDLQRVADDLCTLGFIEKHPDYNEYRRTERGDQLLLDFFHETKPAKRLF